MEELKHSGMIIRKMALYSSSLKVVKNTASIIHPFITDTITVHQFISLNTFIKSLAHELKVGVQVGT